MAIDSAVKRKSIAAIPIPSFGPVIVPDSTIDNPDRQAIGYSYAGIAATIAAFVAQIYTASLFSNPSPIISLKANISPAVNLDSNPTPSKEVRSG